MLADSPATIPLKSFMVAGSRLVQEDKGIRAKDITERDRGNRKTEISMEVARLWPDQNSSETFCIMHDTMLPPPEAMVLITFISGAAGKVSNRYMQGTIQSQSSHIAGCTSWHSYKIVGPTPTSNPPQ